MKFKLDFTYTFIICILIILFSIVYAYNNLKKPINTPLKQKEEYYPYYPYLYKDETSLIYPNENNYRILGDGNLLVWNDTPTNPLLIECRKDEYQKELCDFIIGNNSRYPTSP